MKENGKKKEKAGIHLTGCRDCSGSSDCSVLCMGFLLYAE